MAGKLVIWDSFDVSMVKFKFGGLNIFPNI